MKILCAGAGGFIGGHLVNDLVSRGHDVISVDIKPIAAWYQVNNGSYANIGGCDLKDQDRVRSLASLKPERIYNLAADMGGMGFIENNKAACMLSVLINTNLLQEFRDGLDRFMYASSACVYNADKQIDPNVTALKEEDAYPAMPEDGYGWEKLFSERMCRHFREDFGTPTRVLRFHNVYGPHGTYDGGREKAPAAILRKCIEAKLSGNHEIDIWGDGNQTRSFMYVDDCIKGINMVTDSDFYDPINLGSAELVTINQLVDMTEDIVGVKLKRNYQLDKPQGVRGRNSDNTLIKSLYDWEPSISLREGLTQTYAWIYDQLKAGREESVFLR